MERLSTYLDTLLPAENDFNILEAYAADNHVPIMERESLHFLCQLASLQQTDSILEIGTAIGYSAIRMASALPDVQITTIERDEKMIEIAQKNIDQYGMDAQIKIIPGDAHHHLTKIQQTDQMYDLIFIDAAKAQYEHFFKAAEPLLSSKGIIVCDNVLFKGYVADPGSAPSPRLQKLAKKIDVFNRWLSKNEDYCTSFVPIGDGLAISQKNS